MNKGKVKVGDRSLGSRLNAGDRDVISDIYDNYNQALYGVCIHILKDRELAQDALQKSFVKIWQKGKSFDPSKGKLYTWMLNICRNTAIDIYRSESRKRTIQDEEFSVHIIDQTAKIEYNPDTLDIDDKVSALDQKYREVVRLSYLGGYTQKEISKHLNLPLGTVKTRMRSAIQQLRKIYENQ